jgi:hypothetical protein
MNLAEMLSRGAEKEKVVTTNNHKSFNFLFPTPPWRTCPYCSYYKPSFFGKHCGERERGTKRKKTAISLPTFQLTCILITTTAALVFWCCIGCTTRHTLFVQMIEVERERAGYAGILTWAAARTT